MLRESSPRASTFMILTGLRGPPPLCGGGRPQGFCCLSQIARSGGTSHHGIGHIHRDTRVIHCGHGCALHCGSSGCRNHPPARCCPCGRRQAHRSRQFCGGEVGRRGTGQDAWSQWCRRFRPSGQRCHAAFRGKPGNEEKAPAAPAAPNAPPAALNAIPAFSPPRSTAS